MQYATCNAYTNVCYTSIGRSDEVLSDQEVLGIDVELVSGFSHAHNDSPSASYSDTVQGSVHSSQTTCTYVK